MNETNNIGNNISKYRRKAGLSQEKLAEQAGLSVGYLSKVERSIPTNISVTILMRIAEALSVTLDDLTNKKNSDLNSSLKPNQQRLNNLLDKMDTETSEQLCQNIISSIKLFKQ
ncbi:helix-turn-helix domain-containing protein [Limosilactobacillus agrestimuris]|uniref:helix-turn-helix domain-containing protein n=1 Tax=Limosilactobacillus agrestimuris TaxID=2941331 RepID=UPI0020408E03|nr:helix-turn-helix transcriptional regulator [Limosilactobacillus agrestimuris]